MASLSPRPVAALTAGRAMTQASMGLAELAMVFQKSSSYCGMVVSGVGGGGE